jgi:hypothetical protein
MFVWREKEFVPPEFFEHSSRLQTLKGDVDELYKEIEVQAKRHEKRGRRK